MVAMETKIKHFKCISYHAKIIKFSFGHKDFHITGTDFITKYQLLN
jgi:ATP adenylyltransferase/5',5'''-P-1,P-4-tetraphosphate phosphorylase II